MKTYLLFSWAEHEGVGGWGDFSAELETEEEAREAAESVTFQFDRAHIVECGKGPHRIVATGTRPWLGNWSMGPWEWEAVSP